MKHSPTPWIEVEMSQSLSVIRAPGVGTVGITIADFQAGEPSSTGMIEGFPSKEQQRAHIALFMAGPDMLRSLRILVARMERHSCDSFDILALAEARETIEKALSEGPFPQGGRPL